MIGTIASTDRVCGLIDPVLFSNSCICPLLAVPFSGLYIPPPPPPPSLDVLEALRNGDSATKGLLVGSVSIVSLPGVKTHTLLHDATTK